MAIFHMAVRHIRRGDGRSAVAAAAYRAGQRLYDARYGRVRNFSAKGGVIHSEILLPPGAPERFSDRETLWNAVEAAALRRSARLAQEIEFAVPAEISQADAIVLARRFALAHFVASGLVCDLNLHAHGSDEDRHTPHAHLLVATREVSPLGFGLVSPAMRALGQTRMYREALACETNALLAHFDLDLRTDHRSHAALGVRLVPQDWIGPTARRAAQLGRRGFRLEEHQEIAATNAGRILADPEIALDALMVQHTTFSMADLDQLLARHARDAGLQEQLRRAVLSSPDLVRLGPDAGGVERMTSRRAVELEQDLEALVRAQGPAAFAATRATSGPPAANERAFHIELVVDRTGETGAGRRARALPQVLSEDIASAAPGWLIPAQARARLQKWRAQGRSLRGLSVSEGARRLLVSQTGVQAWTLVGLQNDLAYGFTHLEPGETVMMVEPWALHLRELDWLVRKAIEADVRLVFVTPSEALRGLEAGGAIRRLSTIWLTPAERYLDEPAALGPSGRLLLDLDEMARAGHEASLARALEGLEASFGENSLTARRALVAAWSRDLGRGLAASALQEQLILAGDAAQARRLGALARDVALDAGLLGEVVAVVATSRGLLELRAGERVFFGATDRWMKVRSGDLGSVAGRDGRHVSVTMDDGRTLRVDPAYCQGLAHGYGLPIHHAVRARSKRVFVMPDESFGRDALAVALSRGQSRTVLGFGPDVSDPSALARQLVLDVELGLDPPAAFARRRGAGPPVPGPQAGRDGVPFRGGPPAMVEGGLVLPGTPLKPEEHGFEL